MRFKNCAHRWHHHHHNQHHHQHHHQQQQQLMGEDRDTFWHRRCAKLCNSPTFNPEFSRLHGQRGVIAPKLGHCNRLGRLSDSKTCQAILLLEACDRWIFQSVKNGTWSFIVCGDFIRNLIRIFFLNSSVWFSLDDSWDDASDDPFLVREARPAIV